MRNIIKFQQSQNLREALGISPEREAELGKILDEFGEKLDKSLTDHLEFVWNHPDIADNEVLMIVLGMGERQGITIYQQRMAALSALASLSAAGGKIH